MGVNSEIHLSTALQKKQSMQRIQMAKGSVENVDLQLRMMVTLA